MLDNTFQLGILTINANAAETLILILSNEVPSTVHIVFAQELKVMGSEATTFKKRAQRLGWHAICVECLYTGAPGEEHDRRRRSAGVAILIRSTLGLGRLPEGCWEGIRRCSQPTSDDVERDGALDRSEVCAMPTVDVIEDGRSVLLIAYAPGWPPFVVGTCYPRHTEGFSQANAHTLQVFGEEIARRGLPFIVGADWNLTPDEIHAAMWPTMLGAKIATPDQATYVTCKTESLIDYFIMSEDMHAALASITTSASTIASPHLAVTAIFKPQIADMRVPRLVKTQRYPTEPIIGPRRPAPQEWVAAEQAILRAKQVALVVPSAHRIQSSLRQAYRLWARAMEVEVAQTTGQRMMPQLLRWGERVQVVQQIKGFRNHRSNT